MVSPPCRGGGGLSVLRPVRAMPAVAQLPAGAAKPDGPKRKDQTKRDTLVLQVGG